MRLIDVIRVLNQNPDLNRSFSINLIILLVLNLLVKPLWLFGIEVGVQNTVGAEAYGVYYALFNFTFLFNVLLDLGINNYQRVATAKNLEKGSGDLGNLIQLKLLLALLYVIVVSISGYFVGYPPGYWFFILLLMINQVLSAYLLLLRATIAGMQYFLRDSLLSIADRSVLIFALGYLLLFDSSLLSIEVFVIAQTASYVIAILLAIFLIPNGLRSINVRFESKRFIPLLKQTYPFGLIVLFMTGYHKIDGVMLERLLPNGEQAAGIYAQAYRMLDAGNNFAFIYAGLLLPMFARLLTTDLKAAGSLAKQASILLITPAGILALITFFWGFEIMDLLYDQHATESAVSLKWLMGSFIFICVGNVFGTLLTSSTRLKKLVWLSLSTFILNAILNAFLIPTYTTAGAAMASFISLLFMAAGQVIISASDFGFNPLSWLSKSVLLWVILIPAFWFLYHGVNLNWMVTIFIAIALSGIAYVLVFKQEIQLGIQNLIGSKNS